MNVQMHHRLRCGCSVGLNDIKSFWTYRSPDRAGQSNCCARQPLGKIRIKSPDVRHMSQGGH